MSEQRPKKIMPAILAHWLEKRNYLTIELSPNSQVEFIKQRIITHLRVNHAIISSIPQTNKQIKNQPNSSVRDMLETETTILIMSREQKDGEVRLPLSSELKFLSDDELIELQRNITFDHISKLSQESLLPTTLSLDLRLVRQTGLLIKYLDHFGLKRPDRLNSVWGDNKHQEPKEEELGKVDYWLREDFTEVHFDRLPESLKPIAAQVLDQTFINEKSFADIPENLRGQNIHGKPHSSPDADLRHQVKNMSQRIKDAAKVMKEFSRLLPSDYEIDLMKYDILVSLYKNLTTYLLNLFTIKKFHESTIERYGEKLTPEQFLTTTLEHIMLHQGSLQFFEMLNI